MKIGVIVLLAVSLLIARPGAAGRGRHRLRPRGHRPGLRRLAVPVRLHHHRLRCAVGIPRAHLLGHDAEDGGQGEPGPADRLRRDAHGVLRRDQRAHRRLRHRPGPLLRDEQPGRGDGRHGGDGRRIRPGPRLRHLPRRSPRRRPRCRRTTPDLAYRRRPALAVGISQIFSDAFGGGWQAFWYHFAIMFEALFILTAVDAGTRVGRFMLQDTIGNVWKRFGDLSWRPATSSPAPWSSGCGATCCTSA